jgi:hypothetical protein
MLEEMDALLQALGDGEVEGFDDQAAVRLRDASPRRGGGTLCGWTNSLYRLGSDLPTSRPAAALNKPSNPGMLIRDFEVLGSTGAAAVMIGTTRYRLWPSTWHYRGARIVALMPITLPLQCGLPVEGAPPQCFVSPRLFVPSQGSGRIELNGRSSSRFSSSIS